VAVLPSPKLQLQATTRPSGSRLASVKLQLKAVQLAEKAAVGGWLGGGGGAVTVTDWVVEPVAPLSSVTVSCTVYVPAALYVWLGFRVLDKPSSPKRQLQPTTEPSGSLLPSVNAQRRS